MGEAIFTKYGGNTLDPVKLVSNDTKVSLGLNNNATLDDIFNRIATGAGIDLIDPHNVPFTASLLWYNAQPIVASNIMVTFPDNTTRNYMTDRNGNIQFTSPPGKVTINDLNCTYFDLVPGNQSIDCQIGQNWNNVIMMRNQRFSNGGQYNFTSNQTINLSPCINSYDIECKGCDGKPTTGLIRMDFHRLETSSNHNKLRVISPQSITLDCYKGSSAFYSGNINLIFNKEIVDSVYKGTPGEFGHLNKVSNVRTTGSIQIIVGKNVQKSLWYNGNANLITYQSIDGLNTISWAYVSLYNFSLSMYKSWFLNGDTGSTSSFGSVVFASGGAGGKQTCNEQKLLTNITNYNDTKPSENITARLSLSTGYQSGGSCEYNILFNQPVNNGYVKMMNIQYK